MSDFEKRKVIQSILKKESSQNTTNIKIFFKVKAGEYAAHDKFYGVSVPFLRKLAISYYTLSLKELQQLLKSPFNEERLLALIILVKQFQSGDEIVKEKIYQFYLKNLQYVNNWNLVDASAHLIIGAHLFAQDKSLLFKLAKSDNLWEKRIAIVATWFFIKQGKLAFTFKIAKILLQDKHDLIHKAVGWMLREAGKKDINALIKFLDQYGTRMPRTTLRYAIEKFSPCTRKAYLTLKNNSTKE